MIATNDKELYEKQLIRSIADFIIKSPMRFRKIFPDNEKLLLVFPEMKEVLEINLVSQDGDYTMLTKAISRLPNKSMKAIFIHALESHMGTHYEKKRNKKNTI